MKNIKLTGSNWNLPGQIFRFFKNHLHILVQGQKLNKNTKFHLNWNIFEKLWSLMDIFFNHGNSNLICFKKFQYRFDIIILENTLVMVHCPYFYDNSYYFVLSLWSSFSQKGTLKSTCTQIVITLLKMVRSSNGFRHFVLERFFFYLTWKKSKRP